MVAARGIRMSFKQTRLGQRCRSLFFGLSFLLYPFNYRKISAILVYFTFLVILHQLSTDGSAGLDIRDSLNLFLPPVPVRDDRLFRVLKVTYADPSVDPSSLIICATPSAILTSFSFSTLTFTGSSVDASPLMQGLLFASLITRVICSIPLAQ